MTKNKIIWALALICFSTLELQSQILDKLTFAVQASPGITRVNVNDDSGTPSREDLSADGQTGVQENGLRGSAFKLLVHYYINEQFDFSSGFHFGQRRLSINNQDGSFFGTSVYTVNYASIPLLARYKSPELIEKLKIIGSLGPTIDFRTNEGQEGSDFAHFMNFAQNRVDLDPTRGMNGDNTSKNLFAGIGLSLYASAGVEYQFTDRIAGHLGFSYHTRLTNALNSGLTFNDPDETSITEELAWRTTLLAIDLGVAFNFKN